MINYNLFLSIKTVPSIKVKYRVSLSIIFVFDKLKKPACFFQITLLAYITEHCAYKGAFRVSLCVPI